MKIEAWMSKCWLSKSLIASATWRCTPESGISGRTTKKRQLALTFSYGGEGGSPFTPYAPGPIILPPGTTVKEALLIIDHRLKHPDEF